MDGMLSVMKQCLSRVEELLVIWKSEPLYQRRHKPVPCEENEQALRQGMKARYVIIGGGGKEIHKILKSMNKKLNISPGLPDWKAYCDSLIML